MRQFLRKIRQKPKDVRDNYAFGLAAGFTVVVGLLWLVARPEGSLFRIDQTVSEPKNSPFSTLIKESKEQLGSLKANVPSAKKTEEEKNTSTSPTEIVLDEEDLAAARLKLEASSTANSKASPVLYEAVIIATTSSQVATSTPQ